jgi:heme exporter protein A
MHAPTFLKVSALSCIRADNCLFQNLDFTLHSGEILLIEGDNGAGKTSLLQILAGLLPYETGTITFQEDNHLKSAENIAYLGHKSGIHLDLSVEENITFLMALYNSFQPIAPILDTLNLSAFSKHSARTLSSGQKRRILLSILLFEHSRLWLLDEPLTSLDALGQTLIHDLISKHIGKQGLIVMSSHQLLALENLPIKRLRL